MSKKVNKPEPISEERKNFEEEIDNGTDESVQTELDELESQISDVKPKGEPVEIEEPKAEKEEEVEEEVITTETVVNELPDEFKDKTPTELAKMLVNLRKLKDGNINELGELRKGKKEAEEAVEMAKKYQLSELVKSVIPQMKKWTPEEKQNWLAKLGDDPQATLTDFVTELMKPSLTTSADTRNRQEIDRLKKLHEDAVVPYNEDEVAKILFHNPQMFKQYKSGAFEMAYNVYRDKNFDGFADKRLETKAQRVREKEKIEAEKKKGAFVEPVGPSSSQKRGKIVNLKEKLENMEDVDKALKVLEELIPETDKFN